MPRAPFQVLVFPYRLTREAELQYAIFCRADSGAWQGLAGGGEGTETPEVAARREAQEEAGIPPQLPFLRLHTVGKVPVEHFADRAGWDPSLREIPEHGFGVAVTSPQLSLSHEHSEYAWLPYATALARLVYETNRELLRELHSRLTSGAS